MTKPLNKILVSAAVLTFMISAPAFADTTVSETVTQSPADGTTAYKKTVTETDATSPAMAPATTVQKTVTETAPDASSSTTTTVTTEQPGTTTTKMHWETEEHAVPTGARAINFLEFDLNHDGVMSLDEVARMLFKLYDTDGNEIIDNNEYERRSVVTVVPMEKNTVITYDFDGDGKPDKTQYTYENFMQESMLAKFDKNKDGLSPHEFTGRYFLAADVNHDHAIDLKEWRGTYIAALDKKNKEHARFNK